MATMAVAEPRPFLSGVILAAGGSTRMGRPKQLLPLGGRPLLQHVVDAALAARLDEVVLVLGHRADEIRRALAMPAGGRMRVIVNDRWAEGQSASLRAGLDGTDPRTTAAVVLLGDQPSVPAALIDRLAGELRAAPAPILRPCYPGAAGTPGHPVFLARRVWGDLERLEGDAGARALIAARPELLREVPIEGLPPADVDTWSDYLGMPGVGPGPCGAPTAAPRAGTPDAGPTGTNGRTAGGVPPPTATGRS
jgi:molybdenum cofactor cytidylyltransferase